MRVEASCKRMSIISIAVARGRLGSAVSTQFISRMEERTTRRSDALYVLPEPNMPWTQASLQAREGSKKKARKMSIGSEKGSGESSCEVGSEVEKQG